MKYYCENCKSNTAKSIRFNVVEIDNLEIVKDLVNNSKLSFAQIGSLIWHLFYIPTEEQ